MPQVDLLVVRGSIAAMAAKKLGSGVPTVFISSAFPVEIGLVRSLAHPGGNITGIASEAATETNQKRLQILKEIVPGLKRAAVLRVPDEPFTRLGLLRDDACSVRTPRLHPIQMESPTGCPTRTHTVVSAVTMLA